ncbi:MAG: ATP-binding protein [Nannocystaceae bacterium]
MAQAELDLSDLTAQAVDNLVTQFSSSLDFYRELIQNSIDAGSSTVDVWLEFIAGDADTDEGTIAIHVDDAGEGMSEAIIDNQLTRLFASQKEGDLTKIGKFGIGFVSVFAPRPKAVLLHTGRDGEYWEVCFDADRSFVKARLDTPVGGTQITLFLAGDRGRYGELVAASRETLKRWCTHSDVEVTFEDRSAFDGGALEVVNEPFAVEGACSVSVEVEGTTIVAAYHPAPTYGFYNKGLALAVSRDGPLLLGDSAPRLAHVAFKVKSRYLEHTLSRDTVVQDQNFHKVMAMLRRVAAEELQGALIRELEALCGATAWGLAEVERYHALLAFLRREPLAQLDRHSARKILRTVQGEAMSLDALVDRARRDRRVYVADAPTELSGALAQSGVPVLFARRAQAEGLDAHGPIGPLVAHYLAHRAKASLRGRLAGALGLADDASFAALISRPERSLLIVEPVAERGEPEALLDDAVALLKAIGVHYRKVVSARVHRAEQKAPLFVIADAIRPVMSPPARTHRLLDYFLPPEVAVHRDHDQVRALCELRQADRALAAYCLAKDLLLAEDRREDVDLELMAAALPKLAAGGLGGAK